MVEKKAVSYVAKAETKGFFGNVSHEWMIKFLAHRIADKRVIRMIKRFLKAGALENGVVYENEKGMLQGEVLTNTCKRLSSLYPRFMGLKKKNRVKFRSSFLKIR